MNRFVVKLCGAALAVAFAIMPLNSCAMSNTERALQELKRMKTERYFSDRAQAQFVAAIGRGELDLAQQLLEEGAKVDVVGSEGMTALYWAIAKQNLAGFNFLLERSANPSTLTRWIDPNGKEQWVSVLQLAAMLEDSRYLHALLDAGGDPNQIINNARHTPIFHALLHRRFENVALLIERGADINHRSMSSTTPIGEAVNQRAYALALFLLHAGADPQLKDRWGYSAIDTAKKFGDRGVVIGSEDEVAYPKFIDELKRRGLWGD